MICLYGNIMLRKLRRFVWLFIGIKASTYLRQFKILVWYLRGQTYIWSNGDNLKFLEKSVMQQSGTAPKSVQTKDLNQLLLTAMNFWFEDGTSMMHIDSWSSCWTVYSHSSIVPCSFVMLSFPGYQNSTKNLNLLINWFIASNRFLQLLYAYSFVNVH